MIVALVGYNRPLYLQESFEALLACHGFNEEVTSLVVSIDDGNAGGSQCSSLMGVLLSGTSINSTLIKQPKRRGIVGNTVLALDAAFKQGTDTVMMLEDDGVLRPDSLRLVDWFRHQDEDKYLAMGLSAHGDRSKPNDESAMAEYNYLPCPFAYVVKRGNWDFIKNNWCRKEFHPCGWSWSMTYAARFAGLRFVAPFVSRVKNIGREGGTNETPEHWDASQTGITFSSGEYAGEYDLSHMISEKVVGRIDDWMKPELEADPSRRYLPWIGFDQPEELGVLKPRLYK